MALAPAPAPETLAVLAEGLASSDWMTRLTVTAALGCVPGPQALAWLEQGLADVEPDVRGEAIGGLSHRAEGRARTLLTSVQNDSTEELSLRVLAAVAMTRPFQPCN